MWECLEFRLGLLEMVLSHGWSTPQHLAVVSAPLPMHVRHDEFPHVQCLGFA